MTLEIQQHRRHVVLLRWLDATGKEVAFQYLALRPGDAHTLTLSADGTPDLTALRGVTADAVERFGAELTGEDVYG